MNSYDLVQKVNFEVNSTLTYKSDLAHYGKMENWAIPTDRYGDCEDFALLKFHKLLESGFGHIVLFVETDCGGFILDNNHDLPMNPHDLDYTWEKILRDKKWYVLQSFV